MIPYSIHSMTLESPTHSLVYDSFWTHAQVYENNYDVFEEVDATAGRIAQDGYKMYTNLVRDLIHGYTSDVEKARVLFRSV